MALYERFRAINIMIALNYSSFVLIEFSYLNAIQESFSLQRL